MFHNYFFLKRLVRSLDELLSGKKLVEIFSQNKEELIMVFGSDQLTLRANLDPNISLLNIENDFKRAKRNSVDLFGQLIGKTVTDVKEYSFERSFIVNLEEHCGLLFKMHGRRSNILLVNDGKVISLLRNGLSNDSEIIPEELAQHPQLSREHFEKIDGSLSLFLPALGKEVRRYLTLNGFDEASVPRKWSLFQEAYQKLESNPIRIYQSSVGIPHLSLLEMSDEVLLETSNPIAALQFFYKNFTREFYLDRTKREKLKPLESEIKKTQNYIEKARKQLIEIHNRRKHNEIADIIMANLHQIPKGSANISLQDFYKDQVIDIKLNPLLSPQRHAENLYRKSKKQQIEIDKLQENLTVREAALGRMKKTREALLQAETTKEINSLVSTSSSSTKTPPSKPYHQFEYATFQILIGKNAKSNDELTLKVATKNDLWLHAKDVAGSHVVVKYHPGNSFPKDVIEVAAQIAAWYSKRKTDSLCPVIYTLKKHVRKRKGDPPGAVIVEKESVTLIEPKNWLE